MSHAIIHEVHQLAGLSTRCAVIIAVVVTEPAGLGTAIRDFNRNSLNHLAPAVE
jgi:hypothetical protein